MESVFPVSNISNSNWFIDENQSSNWSKEDNKRFESALAIFDKETPDRWFNVAAMIPGKTVKDVMKQYKELEEDVCHIEAGLIPIPGYFSSSIALEFADDCNLDALRKKSVRGLDQERRKGVPWTEDEHRRFLMGLLEHGKGDWRTISRNHVKTKTPTQVASHAQKYFKRQVSGGEENRRRPSIHDITTESVNLTKNAPSENQKVSKLGESYELPAQKSAATPDVVHNWNYPRDGALMVFGSGHGNLFMSSPYEMASNGLKLQGQNLYDMVHTKARDSVFQIQSTRHQIHGQGTPLNAFVMSSRLC